MDLRGAIVETALGGIVKRLLLALSLALLCATGVAARAAPEQGAPKAEAPPPAGETAEQRRLRLQYEQGVRDAEAARLRYEAAQAQYQRDQARYQRDQAHYRQEVERSDAARADYDRRMAERQARRDRGHSGGHASDEGPAVAAAAPTRCEDQQRRNRRRGRVIGGVLGGVAGIAGSQVRGVGPLAALAAP